MGYQINLDDVRREPFEPPEDYAPPPRMPGGWPLVFAWAGSVAVSAVIVWLAWRWLRACAGVAGI